MTASDRTDVVFSVHGTGDRERLTGRAIVLTWGAMRRQQRRWELRARRRRVDGVLESVRFLTSRTGGPQPEVELDPRADDYRRPTGDGGGGGGA